MINNPYNQKILVIPRSLGLHQLSLEGVDVEFDFVFSTEKRQKDFLVGKMVSPIQFFSGVTTKLPKKLAKKVCETILNKPVVMAHTKK